MILIIYGFNIKLLHRPWHKFHFSKSPKQSENPSAKLFHHFLFQNFSANTFVWQTYFIFLERANEVSHWVNVNGWCNNNLCFGRPQNLPHFSAWPCFSLECSFLNFAFWLFLLLAQTAIDVSSINWGHFGDVSSTTCKCRLSWQYGVLWIRL